MRQSRGFTIVELLVTMAVGSLLVIAAVSMYLTVLGQSPIINTRNTLSTNLQSALNRINDDVRRSSNVTTYNLVPDAYAPTNKTGYENVPGPDNDTDDQYYWRMSENRLLLNQTPVDSSSAPIYDNAQYAAGKKNVIVYYVRDGALYRRVIAAPYANNSVTTSTCSPRVAAGGCIESDIRLVDNLKASLGNAAFKVVYYDRNGNPIPYTKKDSAGNDVPDYSAFPLARAIGVTIALESGTITGNQTVSIDNTMRMQFRSQLNTVPVTVVQPYVPPTNGLGEPGLMVGPGGLSMYNSTVGGGDVYVKGKVTVGFNARMGGSYWGNWFPGGSPVNLNVGNVGCGSGSTYPTPCGSGSQPINASAAFASINGRVCAKDQADSTNINAFGSFQGLIPGCVPPDADMPSFDKASFVNSMTNGVALGSTGSCSNSSTTIADGRTYTGNMSWAFFCRVTLSGSAYITGNLTTDTAARIKVSESAGRVRPIIVVNGKISMGPSTSITPNSYGTTPYFISFFSSDSSCSASSACNSITPTKLKETLDNYTGLSSPISLSNVSAPGASFYAYYGEAYNYFYSSVGALAGQRVNINTGAVTLDGKL